MLCRLRRIGSGRPCRVAAGAQVPLQIADPQHQFGDGRGPRVDLDAVELLGPHDLALQFQKRLLLAQLAHHLQHFAFQPLQVFQGDIEKVARTARGVEDADAGESALEGPDLGQRLGSLAPFGQQQRGGHRRLPLGPQRLDDGRQHQPLDIGARGEVRAQVVALIRVERTHQQRAEDGRLYVAPIGLRGLDQQLELVGGQRQRPRVLEETRR